MTAPSLLDELEGVVRLAEKATPGEWTATVGHDVKQQHGVTVMKAWAGRGPQQEHNAAYVVALVNWFRTHHTEIADMAKRLEAAERDAARYHRLRDADPDNGMPYIAREVQDSWGNWKAQWLGCLEADRAIDTTRGGCE